MLLPALLSLAATACEAEPPPESAAVPAPAATAPEAPRYVRDFMFVGELADTPIVVPFSFRATPAGEEIGRNVRAWLARGGTWESFLDLSWSVPAGASVWRVVPRGDLRVLAGGAAEVEGLVFRRGERTLRLLLGEPLSTWPRGEGERYQMLDSRLQLGRVTVPGTVVEVQRVRPPLAADPPADAGTDWLFLTDGGQLRLVLTGAVGGADTGEEAAAWTLLPGEERVWDRAEVRQLEHLALPPARRDIPVRWGYSVPDAEIEGEVRSLGYDAEVGEERAGRRAVEVLYTVEGWISVAGTRRRVVGVIRHSQG